LWTGTVVIRDNGLVIENFSQVKDKIEEVEPKAIRFTEYVVCIKSDPPIINKTCCCYCLPDIPACDKSINLITYEKTVLIMAAKSGKIVDQKQFIGSKPPMTCPDQIKENTNFIAGNGISLNSILDWVDLSIKD